ncbi:MAG TPA: AAA family ATPase [Terracidiphilus sp.]|nr:AAA family ATPase [Terracidiphilus sp.]
MSNRSGPVPDSINQLREQLQQFRSTHPRRTRLPEALWQAAVEEARQHGAYIVAHTLRLDYANLQKRLGDAPVQKRIRGGGEKAILRLAEQHMARVVFSGDTRQIQSVEASDALRILERESQMKSVALTGVQRQTHAQYRDAIQAPRQAPEQGFEKLERLGAVHEVPFVERGRAVADLYREMTADSSRCVFRAHA